MNVYIPDGYTDDSRTSQEVYSSWNSAIYKYFTYAYAAMGYNPKTNQQVVKFSGYKKEPFQPQIEELMMWLPHIKPSLNEREKRVGLYIGIFEHTLSEFGSWDLWIYGDEYVIYKSRWEEAKFDSLVKCVEYMVNHLWYEKKKRYNHGTKV
jgi:hypothetical protein